MWIADNWKDYEVLATSGGEKLERWGEYVLVRPDPQVIWNTPKTNKGWKNFNGHYHRSSKGGGEWEFKSLPEEWDISYKELTFRLKPFSFKHTGLFPEQAVNWDWCSSIIRKKLSDNPGKQFKVLNLFAYTGGATLSAAKAGAAVTHVDASKGMVQWAKENAAVSGLGVGKTAVCIVDVRKELYLRKGLGVLGEVGQHNRRLADVGAESARRRSLSPFSRSPAGAAAAARRPARIGLGARRSNDKTGAALGAGSTKGQNEKRTG